MLNIEQLTSDQQDAVGRLYEHDHTLMVAKMGAGKTVIALTALAELLRDGVVKRVLIVAPLKVCKTVWAQEAAKWSHTTHLDIALAVGTEKQRKAGLAQEAAITVINFENLSWLFRTAKAVGVFDGLVIDELSKLKSVGGAQFKALRPRLRDFSWRVGLTGTPTSEDWLGLFGQMLIIDGGAALGTRKDQFQRLYFYPTDYMEYNWALHDWAASVIAGKIRGSVYTLPDYTHTLPDINYRTITLNMPAEVREVYDDMAGKMLVELGGGVEVAADNAAVLMGKLQQLSSGFIYDEAREALCFSDFRIRAAVEVVSSGGPWVLCYWYKADYVRLNDALRSAGLRVGSMAVGDIAATVDAWNRGAFDVLLLHPRAAGHGVQLERGGHKLLWFAPQWSRDLWEQTNARLWRTGQKSVVEVVTIEVADTVDAIVSARVEDKAAFGRLFSVELGG